MVMRIRFFQRKVEAGAQFAITQMVFDPDAYGRFLDLCERAGITIPSPGTRILRSRVQATAHGGEVRCRRPQSRPSCTPHCVERPERILMPRHAASTAFCALSNDCARSVLPGIHVFVTHTPSATHGAPRARVPREVSQALSAGLACSPDIGAQPSERRAAGRVSY